MSSIINIKQWNEKELLAKKKKAKVTEQESRNWNRKFSYKDERRV